MQGDRENSWPVWALGEVSGAHRREQLLRRKSGISTSATPPALACRAAWLVRATSARVKRVGVRLILSLDLMGLRIDCADDGLAALVDMDVLDTNVLVTATAQAPVCLDLETMSPH
jgi:hypothetical protein